jgi:hypothetical protein
MSKKLLAYCLILTIHLPAAAQRQQSSDSLYAHQRAVGALGRLNAQIKVMDEPAMRVFLRLQMAKLLWTKKLNSSSNEAQVLAADAVADLQNHLGEVPPLYAGMFRGELLALLQDNAPALAARLVERYDLGRGDDQAAVAYRLLNTEGGAGRALEIMRDLVRGGQIPQNIVFFLEALAKTRPAETVPLLEDIIAREERTPGTLAWDSIFFLNHLYIDENAPPQLQTRFLKVLIYRSRAAAEVAPQDRRLAFNLLSASLPQIEKLMPALYAQAAAQSAAIGTDPAQSAFEREEEIKRMERSGDPVGEMTKEAAATKDPSYKNNLLARAAQLALQKGQLQAAVDLITKIDSGDKNEALYRDQFLGEVVGAALRANDLALADNATAKIGSIFKRASAMQKIALKLLDSDDRQGAQVRTNEAIKLIESADDDIPKASALLGAIQALAKTDEQRIPELAQGAIKIINKLPGPKSEDKPGSDNRKKYTEALLLTAYSLTPAFRVLAKRDEIGALSLADVIQNQEIKTFAMFGVAIDVLLADKSDGYANGAN